MAHSRADVGSAVKQDARPRASCSSSRTRVLARGDRPMTSSSASRTRRIARRRRRAGSPRARRSDHAAAMADVSATVQAVPAHRAAGFRRAPLRIDRRSDARLPEGRPAASRARSPGRAARVRERRRVRARRCRTDGDSANARTEPKRQPETAPVVDVVAEVDRRAESSMRRSPKWSTSSAGAESRSAPTASARKTAPSQSAKSAKSSKRREERHPDQQPLEPLEQWTLAL